MYLNSVEGRPRPAKVATPRNPKPIVTLGNPTIIRCLAVGIPRPTITWWRGTKMLPLSSAKYEQGRDMSLRISIITLRDLGPYTCQAYNGKGRATSNTVTLLAMGPVQINTPKDRDFLPYLVEPSVATPSTSPPPPRRPPSTAFPVNRPEEYPYYQHYGGRTQPPLPDYYVTPEPGLCMLSS